MEKLRYKDYTFPVNPRRLEITYESQLARVPVPFAGEMVSSLGAKAAIVSGEGEFFGANAIQEYLKLTQVYRQGSSGQLYLPGLKPFTAHFVLLKAVGLPGREGYFYTFRFVEDSLQNADGSPERQLTYIVQENETLFAIAARFNTTAERLLAQNPGVASPNSLTAGQAITVAVL